jgi:hypothetical protein
MIAACAASSGYRAPAGEMCRSADLHRARLPSGESNSPTVEAYPTQAATQVQSQPVGESMAETMRGREEVSAEWQIMCLTHNLLKLLRAGLRPQTA